MSELADLYQEVILDHYKHPRNQGPLDAADRSADGYNPLCGDRVTVRLRFVDDRVEEVRFEGLGCAISTASASLMTEAVRGKTRREAEELFERFHAMLTGDPDVPPDPDDELGKLQVFAGVREYPVRVKCATLAWHTLKSALRGGGEVTTE
jgi:nitrogen fixation NifU-like protein